MAWLIAFEETFAAEFSQFDSAVKVELRAMIKLLQQEGPALRRPFADTLNGSKHANMKELRFKAADGTWRVAFAFDPERTAILLVAGDKSGVSQRLFYDQLVKKADKRFDNHLEELRGTSDGNSS